MVPAHPGGPQRYSPKYRPSKPEPGRGKGFISNVKKTKTKKKQKTFI